MTATDIRHRASTALWGMTIGESQIDGFMEHIGHQNQMDNNVYACPPALGGIQINVFPCATNIVNNVDVAY